MTESVDGGAVSASIFNNKNFINVSRLDTYNGILKAMYKIIGGGVLLFISIFCVQVQPTLAAEKKVVATSSLATTTPTAAASIEKQVREYFADIPVMIEIAKCESKFRQFNDSGTVLRGGSSGGMIGVFQFYESIHTKGAQALGFNLATVEGNLGYAKHVYLQQGTTPWRECIPKVLPQTPNTNIQQLQLRIKLLTELVGLLQQLLELKQQTR